MSVVAISPTSPVSRSSLKRKKPPKTESSSTQRKKICSSLDKAESSSPPLSSRVISVASSSSSSTNEELSKVKSLVELNLIDEAIKFLDDHPLIWTRPDMLLELQSLQIRKGNLDLVKTVNDFLMNAFPTHIACLVARLEYLGAMQDFDNLFIFATNLILDRRHGAYEDLFAKYQVLAHLGRGDLIEASRTLIIKLARFPNSEILGSLKREMTKNQHFIEIVLPEDPPKSDQPKGRRYNIWGQFPLGF